MMYVWPLICFLWLNGCDAGTIKNPPGTFSFASYYGPYMVLQQGVRNTIWGYHPTAGATVTLTVGSDNYQTTTVENAAGVVIWELLIDARPDEGPYTITVSTSGSADIVLNDVLFGDVYICSGQSNMAHRLDRLDSPQPEIDDVVNFPKVRRIQVATRFSNVPQDDVEAISLPWAIPTPANMPAFSAICWLYGKALNERLDRPIGLIQSAWGGTRIEAWMSPDALFSCYGEDGPPNGNNQNGASVLYNAMIHPFFKMSIYGAIWYQGENNRNQPGTYTCTQPQMISNWRQEWFSGTSGQTDTVFPFGFVQLAPNRNVTTDVGFPDIRWTQTAEYGYTPNPALLRVFMAVAIDLPDFDSPHGTIHPRFKRPIATRLALGAFAVGYGLSGVFQGPFPTTITTIGSSISVEFDNGTTELSHRGVDGWEVCCAADVSTNCPGADATWTITTITNNDATAILLNDPCADGLFKTGIRYLWGESPCALEQCATYSINNALPAPPFIRHGAF